MPLRLTLLPILGKHLILMEAPEPEVVTVMLKVATGDLSQAAMAKWLRGHVVAQTEL